MRPADVGTPATPSQIAEIESLAANWGGAHVPLAKMVCSRCFNQVGELVDPVGETPEGDQHHLTLGALLRYYQFDRRRHEWVSHGAPLVAGGQPRDPSSRPRIAIDRAVAALVELGSAPAQIDAWCDKHGDLEPVPLEVVRAKAHASRRAGCEQTIRASPQRRR